jgi:AraC family transcriptional regulator of adaptative response / DNA-3-methyladenine glycosylase II
LLAKRLLDETRLSQTEIAFASGFGSLRRFNALFKSRYGLSPRDLRRGRSAEASRATSPGASQDPSEAISCRLEFRPPFAWESLLAYLRLRAIPGVEMVDATQYRRSVAIEGKQGWIGVSLYEKRGQKNGDALHVDISASLTPVIGAVIARVKQLCDLGAVPDAVSGLLGRDPLLGGVVRRIPGLRVPGAFDGFELAVRAILGQQVSVKGATTLAGRWARAFGTPIATPYPEITLIAPTPQRMASVTAEEISALGVVGARARALCTLATALLERRIVLTFAPDVEQQIEALMRLPGIGPWTAQYIAMRALHWPDAFPSGDLMLLRAAQCTKKELEERAQAWRPWRAYAVHYLWQSLGVHP